MTGKKRTYISHQFVEFIPERLDEGVLYISECYGTAVHKCCCGCGEEVVTPLSPTDWSLYKRNNKVTLYPSIGNWSYECQSHYWIRRNKVIWTGQLSEQKIDRIRSDDRAAKQEYFAVVNQKKMGYSELLRNNTPAQVPNQLYSLWLIIKRWWIA